MKKTLDIRPLASNEIDFLKEIQPARLFNVSETLVYERQMPLAGYVLLEGKITLEKRGRLIKEVPVNSLICVDELLSNSPVPHCIKITPGSKAIILDKSTVLEILEQRKGLFQSA